MEGTSRPALTQETYRHHKYTWACPFGSVYHDWSFVGPLGGVNFHVSLTKGYDTTAGLEFHHSDACHYRDDRAPDHITCPITGGRCWHDGTSLYAIEHLWPLIEADLRDGDHEAIFLRLEREADEHFAGYALANRQWRSGITQDGSS